MLVDLLEMLTLFLVLFPQSCNVGMRKCMASFQGMMNTHTTGVHTSPSALSRQSTILSIWVVGGTIFSGFLGTVVFFPIKREVGKGW